MDNETGIKKVYVISHTHWDREWYETFQSFRTRLVYFMDELIDHMERDPEYAFFTMDGQTIVLDDYLEIRPENRERLQKLIQAGRIEIGPWYVMPDEFLVSGESLIRNLMKGIRASRSWGVEPLKSGYVTDIFGHNSQFPQILRGFGINNAVLFRGFHGDADPAEFWWEGVDGSKVLGLKLDEDRCYSDFYFAIRWPFFERGNDYAGNLSELIERGKKLMSYKNERSTTDISLGMDGVDHIEIEPQLPWLMKTLTEELDVEFVHSTLENYLNDLHPKVKDLITLKGEQKALGFSGVNNWVPENVLSSRIHLKQYNQRCEVLLEKWAEPLGCMTAVMGRPYPKSFLAKSWEYLIQNHPHDSICGCSIHQVHQDMMNRFDQSQLISTRMIEEQKSYVVNHLDDAATQNKHILVLFNGSQSDINGVVETVLTFPSGSDASIRMMGHNLQGTSFKIYTADGKEIPYQLNEVNRDQLQMERPYRDLPRGKLFDAFKISLHAQIPSYGYTTLTVEILDLDGPAGYEFNSAKFKAPVRYPGSQRMDERTWDNGEVRLRVDNNGTIQIKDHSSDHEYTGLLFFEDEGDVGDGWSHIAPIGNEKVNSLGCQSTISVVYDGRFETCLCVQMNLRIPKEIQTKETSRSQEWTELPIKTWITLRHQDPIVRFKTVIDNNARDHRIKVMFPSRLNTEHFHTSTPFDLVKRSIAQPDQTDYLRKPFDVVPHNGIVMLHDGDHGMVLYSKGLYETAVHDDPSRTVALTLFRSTRKEVGTNPTDGGQMLQEMTFEYAFRSFQVDDSIEGEIWGEHQQYLANIECAERWSGKFHNHTPHKRASDLPLQHSFLKVNAPGLIVSSLKAAEDESNTYIVRLFNVTDREVKGSLSFEKALMNAEIVNLDEQVLRLLITKDNQIYIQADPRQIITIQFRF